MDKIERKFMLRIIERMENRISDLKTNADLRLLKEIVEMERVKMKNRGGGFRKNKNGKNKRFE